METNAPFVFVVNLEEKDRSSLCIALQLSANDCYKLDSVALTDLWKTSKTSWISDGVYPDHVLRSFAEELNGRIEFIDNYPMPDTIKPQETTWYTPWSKLRLFEWEQYEKILIMDADMLVIRKFKIIFILFF